MIKSENSNLHLLKLKFSDYIIIYYNNTALNVSSTKCINHCDDIILSNPNQNRNLHYYNLIGILIEFLTKGIFTHCLRLLLTMIYQFTSFARIQSLSVYHGSLYEIIYDFARFMFLFCSEFRHRQTQNAWFLQMLGTKFCHKWCKNVQHNTCNTDISIKNTQNSTHKVTSTVSNR